MRKPHKKKKKNPKFIFITGGVVSSVGKGLATASLATLLESRGLKVSMMKFDPYINVDPGNMSPFQHGEVYVTEDGAETDLDLGHYERFTSVNVSRENSVSAGQIYESVIAKERKGTYQGGTVQVIPHITDEIKLRMKKVSDGLDVVLVEIGGTVGDIESLPFMEAIRQMRADIGVQNTSYIHVTWIPYIPSAGELKSKPTQHSVKELREIGIQPDFLICRSEKPLPKGIKNKIALFCSVSLDNVIGLEDAKSIYDVPILLMKEGLDKKVIDTMGIRARPPNMQGWKQMAKTLPGTQSSVTIGILGKHVESTENYKSLMEALVHGGISNKTNVQVQLINSDKINKKNVEKTLSSVDSILIPESFEDPHIEGKLLAIQYARTHKIPFLGICLGFQLACLEIAQNVCQIPGAVSREFYASNNKSKDYIIDRHPKASLISPTFGRLGAHSTQIKKGSLAHQIYKKNTISERHRNQFEFNNVYLERFKKSGVVFSGTSKNSTLVDILEIPNHPWFLAVQFRPEFKSKPMSPHVLFSSFIQAAIKNRSRKKRSLSKKNSIKK